MRGSLVRVVHLGFGWIDLSTTVLGVETSEFWHLVLSTLRTRTSLFFVLISPVCSSMLGIQHPSLEIHPYQAYPRRSHAYLAALVGSPKPIDGFVSSQPCMFITPKPFFPKGPRWQPLHLCRALLVLQCWLATGVHKLFGTIRNKTTPTWIRPRFFILFLFPS